MSKSWRREQVYHDDIARLLKMEDMWAHRKPPRTLDWEALSSAAEASMSTAGGEGGGDASKDPQPSNGTNGVAATTEKDQARIKDQRKLSLKDSFDLFVDAYVVPSSILETEDCCQYR